MHLNRPVPVLHKEYPKKIFKVQHHTRFLKAPLFVDYDYLLVVAAFYCVSVS
jgi:hypothetical protein